MTGNKIMSDVISEGFINSSCDDHGEGFINSSCDVISGGFINSSCDGHHHD